MGMNKVNRGVTSNWDTYINGDLDQLDRTISGVSTLAVNSTTPSVNASAGPSSLLNWQTANTSTTAITNFVNGFAGQQINVICTDSNTSLVSSATLVLAASPFNCSPNQTISLVLIGSAWKELTRSAGLAGTFTGGAITVYNIDNTVFQDGTQYAFSAAGLNTALATNATNIVVNSHATTLSDAVITIGKGQTLYFPGQQTYTVKGIRLTDSSTDNTGTGNINCPDGATLLLANGTNADLVSDTNFGSLTGTTNFYGWVNSYINGCVLDGNKANNTSGFVLRVYGRGERLSHIKVQNGAQTTASGSGMWTEWGGTENDITPANEIECRIDDIFTIYNAGSGWIHKGPNDCEVGQYISDSNGVWGWDVRSPIHAQQVNTFENDNASPGSAGGIHCSGSGSIVGSDVVGSTATGWGMLVDTTCGGLQLTASAWGAVSGIPLEVRSSSTSTFQGSIGNENSGVAALKLNGSGNDLFLLNFFGGTRTYNILVTSEATNSTFIATSDGTPTNWFSGTPGQNDTLVLSGIPGHLNTAITQFPAGKMVQPALGQPGGNYFSGTCSMSSSTTCTATSGATFLTTPLCMADDQSAAGILAASCAVTGTTGSFTVTVTAASTSSHTFNWILLGNAS